MLSCIVQLLHKLSIHASNGPQKLLKVIKNPVTQYMPTGCKKYGMLYRLVVMVIMMVMVVYQLVMMVVMMMVVMMVTR